MKEYCISFKLSERSEDCHCTIKEERIDIPSIGGMFIRKLDENNLLTELLDILETMKTMGKFEYINIRPANAN